MTDTIINNFKNEGLIVVFTHTLNINLYFYISQIKTSRLQVIFIMEKLKHLFAQLVINGLRKQISSSIYAIVDVVRGCLAK